MIIEAGHLALKAALILSLLYIFTGFVGFFFRWRKNIKWARWLTTSVFVLIIMAFAALLQAYVTSDFSLVNVAQNSHERLPLMFKISGVWGNHEGSMLLFILILSFFTWVLERFPKSVKRFSDKKRRSKTQELERFAEPSEAKTALEHFGQRDHALFSLALLSQHAIISAFLIFILATSNPFIHFASQPVSGADLNPLLQDIGLVLHPPLLYCGLVGFSVVFSYAIAALIVGHCGAGLGHIIRPWLLFSWSLLTLGITFGSYWAYYELGWGGYWFWDPVENASLMPWLTATALIHCARVLAKRGALKLWTLLLSIITFSLSLLGTFLVRADLLISVHNFTAMPERSLAILLIMIFFSGGALLLFAVRAAQIEVVARFSPLSREGILTFNNIFLTTTCACVLIGTLYPMVVESLWSEKISVGPPFFNRIFIGLMLPVLIVMPLGPVMGWKQANLAISLERLGLAMAASLAVMITVMLLHQEPGTVSSLSVAAALGLACWLIVGALCDLFFHSGLGQYRLPVVWRRLAALPLKHYGRCLAHGGVGMSLAGIVAVSAFSHETITSVKQGQSFTLHDKIVRFERILPHVGENYLEDRLEFTLLDEQGKTPIGSLYPARRFFPARAMETSEVGLARHGLSHYYIAAGHFDDKGRLVVQAWYKSHVLAIWLGGFFMAAGGLFALLERFSKGRKRFSGKKRRSKTKTETRFAEACAKQKPL